MPSKRYRLKLDHPYAKAGTIVEEDEREVPVNHPTYVTLDESFPEIITIPDTVKAAWLEEVKEEITFTKEQAEVLAMKLQAVYGDLYYGSQHGKLMEYIDANTSKED